MIGYSILQIILATILIVLCICIIILMIQIIEKIDRIERIRKREFKNECKRVSATSKKNNQL